MNNNNVMYRVDQLIFKEEDLLAVDEGDCLFTTIKEAKDFIKFAKSMNKYLLPDLDVYYVIVVICHEK